MQQPRLLAAGAAVLLAAIALSAVVNLDYGDVAPEVRMCKGGGDSECCDERVVWMGTWAAGYWI